MNRGTHHTGKPYKRVTTRTVNTPVFARNNSQTGYLRTAYAPFNRKRGTPHKQKLDLKRCLYNVTKLSPRSPETARAHTRKQELRKATAC